MKEQELLRAVNEIVEDKTHQLIPRPSMELLFTLSSKAYKKLNEECNAKRLGTRPCEINKFCSQFGSARILEGKDQSDDILVYRRRKSGED